MEETLKDTQMDSVAELKKTSPRIKGPEGLLSVEDQGTGLTPVLFAHSFGGNKTYWTNQVNHLRNERRVITFDFRGHGKSEIPSDKNVYSIPSLAEDIAVVADSLGVSQFILVGHSMGGAAAIAYAGTHPDRLAGLVLVGTPGKTPEEQYKPILQSLESDSYQQVMDQYMKKILNNARPEVDSLVSKDFKKIDKETSLQIIRENFEYNPLPGLEKYKGPVLIISTDEEEKQPNSLHHLVPNQPHRVIAGTSHWMMLDKPDEFNRILDEFLKQVDKKK